MIFYCPKHPKKTSEHTSFKIVYRGDQEIPKDDRGNEIRCPNKKCGCLMVMTDSPVDYSTISIGKFSSMSDIQKRDHLKKRAKTYNKSKANRDNKRYQATQHLTNHG